MAAKDRHAKPFPIIHRGKGLAPLNLHDKRQAAPAPTITDIARLANVSTATVSRTLNGFHGVSEETKVAVKRAAFAAGYKPNPSAVKLGKSNVGLPRNRAKSEIRHLTPGGSFAHAQILSGNTLLLEIDLRMVEQLFPQIEGRPALLVAITAAIP